MARAPKPEEAIETTGVVPNLVTHVDQSIDTALASIVAAMERELHSGRQFYTLPVGQTRGVFYSGEARVY